MTSKVFKITIYANKVVGYNKNYQLDIYNTAL